jgi:hypothetical protein
MVRQQVIDDPRDMEKSCKEPACTPSSGSNEGTGEDVWALVALRDGWYVPDGAIEEAVCGGRPPAAARGPSPSCCPNRG